jgi:hypothetical protein
MTFEQFHQEIRRLEQQLAPGSETSVYGDFVKRMSELGGDGWRESDAEVPADEVDGWRKVYELVEADMQLPADERATSVSEFYNRVF